MVVEIRATYSRQLPGSWTIYYDTIYACQVRSVTAPDSYMRSKAVLPLLTSCTCSQKDKRDDAAAGIKSTALLFGDKIKPILALFGGIFVTSLAVAGIQNGSIVRGSNNETNILAGVLNNHGPAFWILAVFSSALQISYQLARVDLDDPASCAHAFGKNTYIGLYHSPCAVK